MKNFKQNFKNWLNESSELNNLQNQSIKQLYIIIRDILFDLKNQMIVNNLVKFNHEEGPDEWIKLCKKFKSEYKIHKNTNGWAKTGCGIEVKIPENIKRVFKNIKTPFYLRFPYEEDEIGGLSVYQDNSTDELRVSLKHLIGSFENYKAIIQHELQHLVDTGSNLDYSQDNLLKRTLNYSCHPGELSAHAKQYAYFYYKLYPNDQELDFNKFKNSFYKKEHVQLNNYINFGEDAERLIKKYGLDEKDQQQMKSCYESFVNLLKRSFLYYKQKS